MHVILLSIFDRARVILQVLGVHEIQKPIASSGFSRAVDVQV